MDINHSYWEENSNIQHMKYESCNSGDGEPRLKDEPLYRCCDSNLNFTTVACSEDDSEYGQYKKNKVSRQDPMSHRIIEKRRRDRMNNCLAELSRLIPADYLKKGRGRIEKTEIIEMAIKHIKYLQLAHRNSGREEADRSQQHEQYRLGYQECMSETMRFLVEVEGYFAREALCVRLINHLQKHCDALLLRDHVNNSSKVSEKEYISAQSIPTLLLPNTPMNNSSQPLSPARQLSEHDNSSHLRDMLTGNLIKDEIQVLSPQIRPASQEPIPQITLDNEKIMEFKSREDFCQKSIPNEISKPERSESDSYSNGASLYKFKNNIKQRFSQDLNAENVAESNQKLFKRRKVESVRRNSVTTETYSSENRSSPIDGSQCSPPSSEMYRLSSESENARISPTGSSVSDFRTTPNRYMHLKSTAKNTNGFERFSPTNKHQNGFGAKNSPVVHTNETEKSNFEVPIFVLHAKGSFYIPLTIDYHTLVPYLQHQNILDMLPNVHNIILHPVTINVNFQSNYYSSANTAIVKPTKHKMEGQNGWH